MLDKEVVVCPLLEARVELWVVLFAHVLHTQRPLSRLLQAAVLLSKAPELPQNHWPHGMLPKLCELACVQLRRAAASHLNLKHRELRVFRRTLYTPWKCAMSSGMR